MTTPAISRCSLATRRTWLATSWPAVLWVFAAVVITIAGAMMIPEGYRQAVAMTDIPEPDRAELRRTLADLHLSPRHLAWFEFVVFNVVGNVVNLTVGWLLIRRAPRSGFAVFLAFVLLAQANASYPPSIDDLLPGQPIAQAIIRLTTVVGIAGFFTLPFIFPDGRFVPRWTVFWGVYNVVGVTVFAFAPSLLPDGGPWPTVEIVMTVLTVLSIIYSIAYRYRKVSTPEQRRQTRWVVFGLLIGVPAFFVGDIAMRNIGAGAVGVACLFLFLTVMPIATTLPTAAVGVAILNQRLFDIDVVLGRTLVWIAMTATVIGAYVGLVLGVGELLGSQDSLVLSLVATGVVAVAFQPVRARVQRGVDRLLFGDRDDPYAVLARLGHRIEDTLSPAELLPAIVRTTQEALRLPYAALFLERPGGPVLAAASGVASGPIVRLPMVYQGQTVGALEVSPRGPGETFGAADRRLLEDLARQVGVAARTVSLATDLQHSRERIVVAREEERRRLRRDLHDGLGAQLAALILQAGAIRPLFRADPDAADREITGLRDELRAAVADIRRLVAGLRPPALDELGLAGALRERLARLDRPDGGPDAPGLRVRFTAADPLPPLPAAVEVAAFRIVEEAVTNVVRHASARSVDVTVRVDGDALDIAVTDDGVGLTASESRGGAGLGLQSMRERATELGGACTVAPNPGGPGTRVSVTLPLTAPDHTSGPVLVISTPLPVVSSDVGTSPPSAATPTGNADVALPRASSAAGSRAVTRP